MALGLVGAEMSVVVRLSNGMQSQKNFAGSRMEKVLESLSKKYDGWESECDKVIPS